MSKSREYSGAALIMCAAVLGAVTILLVPGLFEDFGAGRLITILVLTVGMGAFAVAAKRKREQLSE